MMNSDTMREENMLINNHKERLRLCTQNSDTTDRLVLGFEGEIEKN